ncbi:hypothetical protein [Deinococcus sp.]|uniref:hypothetical protein n=1 Tax=Deinococcus sp. TaxID=47478 RepID=UPI003B5C1A79
MNPRAFWIVAVLALLLGFPAHAAAVLEGRTLTFEQAGQTVASVRFAPELGDLVGPVTQGGSTWLGIGPVLYRYDALGVAQTRLDFPDLLSSLDNSGGVLRVTSGPSAAQDSYSVVDNQIQERVVFVPDAAVTTWLARAAASVPDAELKDAVKQDPTNPFLALRLAQQARQQNDSFTALSETQRAASLPLPFPASLQLAARFEALASPSAANLLLSRAARDFAARGYDPALPLSRAAQQAYGDPLGELDTLLERNQLERADVWIRYLRETSPRFEGWPQVYARYAALLDAQNRSGEAEEWRAFSRSLTSGTLYNLGPNALLTLRDAARLCALALALCLLAAALTLTARAWRVQGRDTAEIGGRWLSWLRHPLSRMRRSAVAYAGWGEKLVVFALLAGLLVALSAWTWAARSQQQLNAPALGIGTYGGAWFYNGLDDLELRPGRDSGLLRGLAAQLDGDDTLARSLYAAGGAPLPCAQNNLGVLAQHRGDALQARELWRSALSASPDLLGPAYNLGLQPSAPQAVFQREYRSDPRLCYPDQRALVRALNGGLAGQLGVLAVSPWQALLATPTGLPTWLQGVWAALLLIIVGLNLVWLLTPAPETAPRAGRPPLFRVLALLLPGTALLDGAWGAVLLLGWAAALGSWLVGRGSVQMAYLPGVPENALLAALLILYLLNALGVVLQEVRGARAERSQRAA